MKSPVFPSLDDIYVTISRWPPPDTHLTFYICETATGLKSKNIESRTKFCWSQRILGNLFGLKVSKYYSRIYESSFYHSFSPKKWQHLLSRRLSFFLSSPSHTLSTSIIRQYVNQMRPIKSFTTRGNEISNRSTRIPMKAILIISMGKKVTALINCP